MGFVSKADVGMVDEWACMAVEATADGVEADTEDVDEAAMDELEDEAPLLAPPAAPLG